LFFLARINLPKAGEPSRGGQAGWSEAEIPVYRENSKTQISNIKWFDKLTTLS